jgi:acyl-CoA dehydrogenase
VSGTPDLLEQVCASIFADGPRPITDSRARFDRRVWEVLVAEGLVGAGVPEAAGGGGGGVAEVATVLRVAGEHAARVPLAEAAMLGGPLLASAGLAMPSGVFTVGAGEVLATATGIGWRLTGTLRRVAYARDADVIVGVADAASLRPRVFLVDRELVQLAHGENLAGEPRDTVLLDVDVPAAAVGDAPPGAGAELELRGALSRAVLLAGAVTATLRLTVRYCAQRSQFGRPIGAFQAVQQQVAVLASEAAAARAAGDAAVETCHDHGVDSSAARLAIAAAKVSSGRSAGIAAALAHQVHGAIGLSLEHELGRFTTRLWSWREEWGSARRWSQIVTQELTSAEGGAVWPALASS